MNLINKTVGAVALGLTLAASFVSAAEMEDTITVTSPAFEMHKDIPLQFSAYGENISPALMWGNLPAGTKQLALVLDDPIVAMPQPFVHWVAYNIPATASGLPQALSKDAMVASVPELAGMINGVNGARQTGYFGPRPPADGKVHQYHFRIYALDAEMNLAEGLNKEALLEAIDGHILGTGMLMGHYQQQ